MIKVKISAWECDIWWGNFMLSIWTSYWISLSRKERMMMVNKALEPYHGRVIEWCDSDFYRHIGFESEEHYTGFLLRWS